MMPPERSTAAPTRERYPRTSSFVSANPHTRLGKGQYSMSLGSRHQLTGVILALTVRPKIDDRDVQPPSGRSRRTFYDYNRPHEARAARRRRETTAEDEVWRQGSASGAHLGSTIEFVLNGRRAIRRRAPGLSVERLLLWTKSVRKKAQVDPWVIMKLGRAMLGRVRQRPPGVNRGPDLVHYRLRL